MRVETPWRKSLVGMLCAWPLFASPVAAQSSDDFGGHAKSRFIGALLPSDSIFNDLTGSSTADVEHDLRLNIGMSRDRWSFDAAVQLQALYGERIEYSRRLPSALRGNRLPNDDQRGLQLTSTLRDSGKLAMIARFDRLSVAYIAPNMVLRLGRQVITWGNGLFFSPMDIVNPFDPSAIDTEYKAGDDMLFAQVLMDSGDDLQGALVLRRDKLTGDIEARQSAVAIKYHGVVGVAEYDVLLAQSFDDVSFGIGGNRDIGGAVVRGDLVFSDSSDGIKAQALANVSYSWRWGNRNVSGVLEYYFNGFGQPGERYAPAELAANPGLTRRIARSDSFSLGRHYLAGSLIIEMTPLWRLTPTMFANLGDPSALAQIITTYDVTQNVTLLGSLNLPLGANGTEYGGVETNTAGRFLSSDLSVFAQLGWYF